MTRPDDHPHRPWALGALAVLMAAGSAIGVYMARHHEVELYGGAEAGMALVGCEASDTVNCGIVNTSPWSEVLGVPTFAWAVPTYLLVIFLAALAWRGRHGAKTLIAGIGLACVAFSGWLWYVSVYELGYVCLWCMRLYAINAAIPVLAWLSGLRASDRPTARDLGQAAAVFAVAAALTVGVQQAYRSTLLGSDAGSEALAAADAVGAAAAVAEADPEGPAPARTIPVTTEDGRQAELRIRPGDAWKGNPDAEVALVEFADFECGYCKRASFQLRRLYEAYKDEVLFVFKHFPMDPACNPGVRNKKHRDACNAHVAAVCAQEQGRFWQFHDLLFKNNHQLEIPHLETYVEAVGLDREAFVECVRSPRARDAVATSAQDGADVDTHGTPRIWIGGRLYRAGTSAEQLARALEAALGRTGAEAVDNAAALRPTPSEVAPIPDDVPDMRRVTHGGVDVRIDTFEASLIGGAAAVGVGQVPATRMSWYAAQDACDAVGKRLCTEEEWITACQGAAAVDDDDDGAFADDIIEGRAYPYGDLYERNTCWDDCRNRPGLPEAQQVPWRPVYTGEMPACVSVDGVYDLAGNVEEWVGTTEGTAVLVGGAFDTPDDKARCYRRNDTFGPGYASLRTGFRCCQDP